MASTAYGAYAQQEQYIATVNTDIRTGTYYDENPLPTESPLVLSETELVRELHALGNAQTTLLDPLRGWRADTVSFQPRLDARSQDRLVVKQLDIHGQPWTLTAVFDGHLGEDTVEHTAYHLPIIIEDFLRKETSPQTGRPRGGAPAVADVLRRAISSFDAAIAGDILNLFPGGLDGLAAISDAQIAAVLNDDGPNFKKARLCLYGTTALLALVDPTHENLWCANLGDCQAVLVTFNAVGQPQGEPLSAVHNGTNAREVGRVRAEHPGEAGCVHDGRVLGVIGPFRCIGDTPFKLAPLFTRKVLYNLTGCAAHARVQWESFLVRNLTPPYISVEADVVHRVLAGGANDPHAPILVLCSDGLVDFFGGEMAPQELADDWARALGRVRSQVATTMPTAPGGGPANLAVELLRHALGGDAATVSSMLRYDLEVDDTSIVVAIL